MIDNVLIVDDSASDRSILKVIIERNIPDTAVIELDDGSHVKQVIAQNNISVCILDLKMANTDGFETLKALKEDAALMDVPVIVCSGLIEVGTLQKVLEMGAFDYFSKPLSNEVMKVMLPLKVRNAIELRKRTRYIAHLSEVDALTGLLNRNAFRKYMEQCQIRDNLHTYMLMCDINGLKIVNDAYGSDAGDIYLTQLAKILKRTCPGNAVISRWGGDEFTACLHIEDQTVVQDIVKQIKSEFARVDYQGLALSVACGYDKHHASFVTLNKAIVNAEDAMFRDKVLDQVSVRSNSISTILATLHEKNPREESHSRRVSEQCRRMGEALGWSEGKVQELKVMGLVHDIGKIAIDERILNKPGKLTPEEWLEMKRHPEIGYRLLSASPEMKVFAHAILSHHERVDGNGYPNGLLGEAIPRYAKILTIVDAYDAMTCERTYRVALSPEEACKELLRGVAKQFDQEMVEVFIEKVVGISLSAIQEDMSDGR